MSIGSTIHTWLRSTVYEVLASVSSLGQGERGQRPGWVALAPPPPHSDFLTALS